MKYIQNPKILLSLLGLSLLPFFIPLLMSAPPRVPGFVPPDFETSPHEVPVTLPACDENALIIDASTDLGQIDWHAYDVFCVRAGNYTA